MDNVLQEITGPELTRAHVERRVADWIRRIDSLYSTIGSWLPSEWTMESRRTVSMYEELMQRFDVPARTLPVLDLFRDGQRVASIEPRGLWIVGANGRLDFTRNDERFLITDESENFGKPSWRIAAFSNRSQTAPLDRKKFLSLL